MSRLPSRAATLRSLGGVAAALSLVAACDAPTPTGGESQVAIGVAALSLPGVDNACYTLTVTNGLGATVWTRSGLCADAYGDGAGSFAYVGTCDAASNAALNTVSLTLEGLYGPGGALIAPETYHDPTATEALHRDFTCREGEDVAVAFDITLARAANQGFFDVAVTFDDLFCSAKFDCRDANDQPLSLLFDSTGARAPSAVLAFACTGGPGATTVLYLSDLTLTCGGPITTVDPTLGPGRLSLVSGSGLPNARLFDALVTRGVEQLGAYDKHYWTVTLGLTDVAGCTLTAEGTASNGALPDGAIPAGATRPYIAWDVPFDSCTRHPLDGPDGAVATAYSTGAAHPFAHSDVVVAAAPSICGDGLVEGSEACDDGTATNGTGGVNANRITSVVGTSGATLLLSFDGPAGATTLDDASAADHPLTNTASPDDQTFEQTPSASAATYSTTGPAWACFDDNPSSICNVMGTANQWYAITFDAPRRITRVRVLPVLCCAPTNMSPRHWRIDGSDDGVTWTKVPVATYGANTTAYLGDEVAQTIASGWAEVTLANSRHFERYRLYIRDIVLGSGGWLTSPVNEIEMFEEVPVEVDACDKVVGSGAALFSGADALAAAPSSQWNFGAQPLSFVAWVKTSTGGPVVSLATSPAAADLVADLRVDPVTGRAVFQAHGSASGPAIALTSPAAVNTGAWHLLAATRSADTWTLYVDGAAVATQTAAGTLPWDPAASLHIGRGAFLERRDLTAEAPTLAASAAMNPDGPIAGLIDGATNTYANVLGLTNQWYSVTFPGVRAVDMVRVLPLSDTHLSPWHWRIDVYIPDAWQPVPVATWGANASPYLTTEVTQAHVADWSVVTLAPHVQSRAYRLFIRDIINSSTPNPWGTSPVRELDLWGPERFARFSGRLDEVSVWRRALSAAELTALYSAQHPVAAPSCGGSACTTGCSFVAP